MWKYVACVFSTISLILLWFNLILPFLAKTHVEYVACVFSTISLILLWFNLILPYLAKMHVEHVAWFFLNNLFNFIVV